MQIGVFLYLPEIGNLYYPACASHCYYTLMTGNDSDVLFIFALTSRTRVGVKVNVSYSMFSVEGFC